MSGDSVCYHPEVAATYKFGSKVMFKNMSKSADTMGLFKMDFDVQQVKMYLIINSKGEVINVLNAGCVMDERVGKIITKVLLQLKDFDPAIKSGEKVTSAKLMEFKVYQRGYQAEFEVRVKLDEPQKAKDKDFSIFMGNYSKQIKEQAVFPKNYKREKYDGMVTIEFSFNKKGKPTGFSVLKTDKDEFIENALVALFSVKEISNDYLEMMGLNKKFVVTFDFVSFADVTGFMSTNH